MRFIRSLRGRFARLRSNFRLSYLPPSMVYFAAGISGLTSIVGAFFVKDYLGLSAAFLASLGFWAGVPWTLKIPLGHLVDLFWRWKGVLVLIGASIIACSLAIMVGLLGHTEMMVKYFSIETWYIVAAILSPVGYVVQDVVADAMTVEAVPRIDAHGTPREPKAIEMDHKTMQTIGRAAVVGGGIAIGLLNVIMFRDIASMDESAVVDSYLRIYYIAFLIPLVSVLGVILEAVAMRLRPPTQREKRDLRPVAKPNWMVLGISAVYVSVVVGFGLQSWKFKEEIIFAISLALITALMIYFAKRFTAEQRKTFFVIAIVIFVFRAMPGVGPGYTWFAIDVLGFDQGFLSKLMLVGSTIAFSGILLYRSYFAHRPILSIYRFLTIVGFLMGLPNAGLYFGIHNWTSEHTNGRINARTIALIDTASESPLGQVSMLPSLSWIAACAPEGVEATFFAVVASSNNLALSASSLITKHLNQMFIVTRQVEDPLTGVILQSADYSHLGNLMITVLLIGLVVPLIVIFFAERILESNKEDFPGQ